MTKYCSKCDNTKSLVEFGKNRSTRDGLTSYCKLCKKELSRKYREENYEKSKESLRASYHKHIEKREAYRKAYRVDPEKQAIEKAYRTRYNIENKDKIIEYRKEWQSRPESKRLKCAAQNKRRATKLNATPSWADLKAIQEFYKGCPQGYHVDHIIPLQGKNVCGLHVLDNLQYLTAEENLKKGNK